MNRLFILFSALAFTSVFVGCGRDYESDLSKIIKVDLKDSLQQYDKIVLIPGSGCTGCISNAEDYFFKNVGNNNILFILTNNFSEKGLKLRLGADNLSKANVIVDEKNTFYLRNYKENIYPVLIDITNGRIVKIQTF